MIEMKERKVLSIEQVTNFLSAEVGYYFRDFTDREKVIYTQEIWEKFLKKEGLIK